MSFGVYVNHLVKAPNAGPQVQRVLDGADNLHL